MNCYNCGLPDHTISTSGFNVRVTIKAENRMQRDKHHTVWCCTRDCVVQSIAVAELGPTPSKWSMTLAEFSRRVKADRYEDLSSKKNPPEVVDSNRPKQAKNEVTELPQPEGFSLRKQGGRPRKYGSTEARKKANAEYQRKFRHRSTEANQ